MTEKARWMLEGSHGMARDADAAVALLEEKVKDGDAEAMWMLGVCCEFGMGTEQDVDRAEQLYKRGAEQGNATAMLLTDELKNKNGRGCTQTNLKSEKENNKPKTKDLGINSCGGQIKIAALWWTVVHERHTEPELQDHHFVGHNFCESKND